MEICPLRESCISLRIAKDSATWSAAPLSCAAACVAAVARASTAVDTVCTSCPAVAMPMKDAPCSNREELDPGSGSAAAEDPPAGTDAALPMAVTSPSADRRNSLDAQSALFATAEPALTSPIMPAIGSAAIPPRPAKDSKRITIFLTFPIFLTSFPSRQHEQQHLRQHRQHTLQAAIGQHTSTMPMIARVPGPIPLKEPRIAP
mmetsp:Transcript_2475/g.5703  ORF Transcript_2475/g.5703 Transcript_2475/m.5703 type:complete len:204 (+) Transcript_2475:204-815(+)